MNDDHRCGGDHAQTATSSLSRCCSAIPIELASPVMIQDIPSTSRLAASSLLVATLLSGCGGGGGGSDSASNTASGNTPVVTASVAGTAIYGKPLVLTLTGTSLDQGIAVSATGCDGVAIDPLSSGPKTAQYSCKLTALGAGQFVVTRASSGATLSTVLFNVPAPQVTLSFSNGAGVTGAVVLTLSPDKAPATVKNFLDYVNSGFYVGTVFHRVSPGFVVQGGGYLAPLDANNQNLKPVNAPIPLEVGNGLSNTQWTIAMARTSDPASATSQFFINLADNSGALDPGLSAGYAVFGTVTSGTADIGAIVGAPCAVIPLFLPTGECTPTPNMAIVSASQTR